MTKTTRLKIAYLCDMDPRLAWTYSGGNKRIHDTLQEHVGDVDILSNDWAELEPLRRLIHKLPEAINLRARWRLHLLLSRVIARSVHKQLKARKYDVLFCPYSFQSLAQIKPPYPLVTVFTSDATQTSYRTAETGAAFGSYFKLSRLMDPWILKQEKTILSSVDMNFWPSDWQKSNADACYDLPVEKSIVTPWGANIPRPDATTLYPDLPFDDGVRLLLVGRDWWAKGGPLTLDVLRNLRGQGINARLGVVGCTPPASDMDDYIDIHPNLDKTVPRDLTTLQDLFRRSHFLVQPSIESYGFAFCEASAFGLPSLCLRLGGVPVWDEVNGIALPSGAAAADFSDVITTYMQTPARYQKLRASSRQCYEDRLNWPAWAAEIQGHLLRLKAGKTHD